MASFRIKTQKVINNPVFLRSCARAKRVYFSETRDRSNPQMEQGRVYAVS